MFKATAFACLLSGALVFASPACAQRAKVSQGPTTSELALEVAASRQQSADLHVQMNALLGDLSTLNGRVETLEYQLSEAREAADGASADNEVLAKETRSLKAQVDSQARAIQQLEARLASFGAVSTPSSSTSSGTTGTSPTVTTRVYTSPSTSTPTPSSTTTTTTRVITPSPSTSPTRPAAASGTGGSGLGTIPASALPGDAGALFASARTKLLQFDYEGAETDFRAFIDAFGTDPQAGEAYYWLGDALHKQSAYAESGAAYSTMIRAFPDDPRAPDALVRLARAMRLVGDTGTACAALDTLPKRYATTSQQTRDLAAVERTNSKCPG